MTTLAAILKQCAMGCEIAGNVAMLELKNSPPDEALKFLTPTSNGGGGRSRDNADLAKNFKNFMRYYVTLSAIDKSPLTGSCGLTSQWLDRVTSKGNVAPDMLEAPTAHILAILAAVTQPRWYCRFTCGSHSFLIEHVDSQYAVYQSFIGSQSIHLSVTNITKGRHVFKDKAAFFNALASALLDAQSYSTVREKIALDRALAHARREALVLNAARITELSEAMNAFPAPGALWHSATPAEKRVLTAYDQEMGEIVDMVLQAGPNQQQVFHGSIWTSADPSQYRLNTDPASVDEIATNIALGIRPHQQKWTTCFQDTKSSMKTRLKTLGVAL